MVIPFESGLGGGVEAIARTLLQASTASVDDFDFRILHETKPRSSFSHEEIDLAAIIAEKAGGKMAQVFLNALDGRNKRFGENRKVLIPSETVEKLNEGYTKSLEALIPDFSKPTTAD